MKYLKIMIILTILLIPTISASNLDFRLDTPDKLFYPNEKIPLNISLINRDTTSIKTATLTVISGTRTYTYDIEILKPSETFQKEITLPEFPAGTQNLKGILNYTGFLDEKFVEETYGSFEVLFPKIERYPRNIYVSNYDLPEKILSGKEYEVSITIKNDGDVSANLLIEFGSTDKFFTKETKLNPQESTTVKMNVKFDDAGISLLEARAYALINGDKYLLNYRGKGTFVQEERKAILKLNKIELVNEGDNAINQEDKVKLKIYLTNDGETATNIKTELISTIDKLNIINSKIDYVTIANKDNYAPNDKFFEIETKGIDTNNKELILKVDYEDSEIRTKEIQIPLTIQSGSDSCLSDSECLINQICSNKICKEISCECGEIIDHKCNNYACCENSQCTKDSICDITSHSCKSSGILSITLLDSAISKPVTKAYIYINNELKGTSNDKGIFQTSLMSGEYEINIQSRGYSNKTIKMNVNEKKMTNNIINLTQLLGIRFDIPSGFEKYVYAKQASWTTIHPQEEKLMSYSFPLYSSDKVDIANDLITVVDKYLTYDYTCLDNPTPATCQAWHNSEYDIINTHKGVCYDWATLGTSFTNSYGIPARFTHGCWQYKSLTGGEGKSICHAWEEVYLPEIGGWKHLDTLWDQFDNPCIYSQGSTVNCVFGFANYNPETSEFESTNMYNCNKECSKFSSNSPTSQKAFSETQDELSYSYNINIKDQKNADVIVNAILNEKDSEEIRNFTKSNTLNKDKIKEVLISIIKPQFEKIGKIEDITLEIENIENTNKLINEKLTFKILFPNEISQFEHKFVVDQFTKINYTIKTPLNIIYVSPMTNNKLITKENNEFQWQFYNAGTVDLKIQFKIEKIGFVVNNNPIINEVMNSTAQKLEAKIYEVNNNVVSNIINDKLSTIYLLGSYTEISSDIENNLKKNNIKVIRLSDEDYILSAKLATIFWQQSDKVIIADSYDFDSIKKAKLKSLENHAPLLLIKEDELSDISKDALKQLNIKKIIFSDPNLKVSENVKSQLKNIAELEENSPKSIETKISIWKKIINWFKSLF